MKLHIKQGLLATAALIGLVAPLYAADTTRDQEQTRERQRIRDQDTTGPNS